MLPRVAIAVLHASQSGLKGKRPVHSHAFVVLFRLRDGSRMSSHSLKENMVSALHSILLWYCTVGVLLLTAADRRRCFVAFSIAAWNLILIPASFGCDQMEVCDDRKKGKIRLLMSKRSAWVFQRHACPSRRRMIGSLLFKGWTERTKCWQKW